MKLSQEEILLLDVGISIVISFIVMVVVHDRDVRKIEKSHEETQKGVDDGIQALIDEFSEPTRLELWHESFVFGFGVGFIIFLIFLLFSCSVQAN